MSAPRKKTAPAAWIAVIALLGMVGLAVFGKFELPLVALIHVGVFSVITAIAFVWDKWRAVRNGSRVSEATLLSFAILGGALGALLAMLAARHKTRRPLFWIVTACAAFIHVTIVGWLFIRE